jgi:hypothetical protein
LRGRVDPRFFAILRELAAWRETAAQQRNLPRGRIMRDEAVLEVAAHSPKSIDALARTRSLGKGVAEGKLGNEILDAVRRGLAETEGPAPPSRADVPPGLGPLVELLRVLLKQRCEEHQVAQKLVATGEDLEAVAADDDATVPALSGWRYEIFGKDALALKPAAGDDGSETASSGRARGRRLHNSGADPVCDSVGCPQLQACPFPAASPRCGAEDPARIWRRRAPPLADIEAVGRWDFEDQAIFLAVQPRVRQEISRAAAQGVGETKRQAERANLRSGSLVKQMAGRLLDQVVDAAAIAGMQHRGDKYPVGMADAGKRHPQASGKGELGAVVGMLAPGDVTEPASGAMKSLGLLG